MASGIDFTGNGDDDVSGGPSSTGQPERATRGAKGPIDFTGDGGMDVGGTIANTNESGVMPKGGDVIFTGNGGDDL